jgi:hypothetical protein
MRGLKKGDHAMSLAETSVAASLLCLLLITVLNLFPSALAAVSSSRQHHEANVLAQNVLETFAARPFGGLDLGIQSNTGITVPQGFTLVVDVQPVDSYSTEFLKKVTATVTWRFRNTDKQIQQELYLQPVN